MKNDNKISPYLIFDPDICTGCAACVKACPTKAIRIKNDKSIRTVDYCITCGECVRICPHSALSSDIFDMNQIGNGQISVAIVSPVLYSQFPEMLPEEILTGLKKIGFDHTIDLSRYTELFQYATDEFIKRNKISNELPTPLISPICPVIIRLIMVRFPNLLDQVIPLKRPVELIELEIKQQLSDRFGVKKDLINLCNITPCPSQKVSTHMMKLSNIDSSVGINKIYRKLSQELEKMEENDTTSLHESYESARGPMWGMSGGEIAGLRTENTFAVSGLNETITYLEKIELGLFQDIDYIEFRCCPEGCIGGPLTVTDKYLAKNTVHKLVERFGIGRRLSQEKALRIYEKGFFFSETKPSELTRIFGIHKDPLSIELLKKMEKLLDIIQGKDCSVCGAPDCRTFAEDVVRGKASIDDCIILKYRDADTDEQIKALSLKS
ncbi:MAG: 4Fe-4S binding protein [Deltaproteobacteria bacterium]|nr:4Fe-4S binding protein [Deltaproteobacteria bacterium]